MPVEFLSDDQARRYGRFTDGPCNVGVLPRRYARMVRCCGQDPVRQLVGRALVVPLALCTGLAGVPSTVAAQSTARATPDVVSSVSPKDPRALAMGRNDDLYMVDTGRDRVLVRLPDGRFRVVAGNGRWDYSGNGGPAVGAALGLEYDSGIAVAADGTVYFSDSATLRVREVTPTGEIETVAGGGKHPLGRQPVPAPDAELASGLGSAIGVAGLTIGPGGASSTWGCPPGSTA